VGGIGSLHRRSRSVRREMPKWQDASCSCAQFSLGMRHSCVLANVLVTNEVDSAGRQQLSEVIEAPHQLRDEDMRAHH
jgi:hypothetical protein